MHLNRYLILFVILILTSSKSLANEEKNQDLQMFVGDWVTNCSSASTDSEKICTLERSMFVDQNFRNKLVTIVMQTRSSSKDIQFTLVSPLGTLIQQGVKIGFDEKLLNDNAYAFNVCQQLGCVTSFKIENDILNRFKKGNTLDLEYISPANQKIKIKFNLDGFTKAFEKIAQN